MDLVSPKGKKIVGTYETLEGCAKIDKACVAGDGHIDFTYEGTTEVWWDNQKTVQRNRRPMFVDEDGGIWTEAQVVRANKKKGA